jgi:hypothetical protein
MSSATRRETDDTLRELLVQDELVHEMICRRAYEIYERRGSQDGHDREDWLQAEREILEDLMAEARSGRLEAVLTEAELTDYRAPQPHQSYYPAPETAQTSWPAVAEMIAFEVQAPAVRPLHTPEAPQYLETPARKREKTPKPVTTRKRKKAASLNEQSLAAEPEKAKKKKSGHKSKEGKSKESKRK